MPIDQVNEKSTAVLTVTFKDENGALVTPSQATCRIDDALGGVAIRTQMNLDPTGSSKDIVITPDENVILDTTHAKEERVLTLAYTYGSGKQGTMEYRYEVMNLRFMA